MGYGILSGITPFSSSIYCVYCELRKIYQCEDQGQIAVTDINFEGFFIAIYVRLGVQNPMEHFENDMYMHR